MSRTDLRYLTALMAGLSLAGCGGSGALDDMAGAGSAATTDARLASEMAAPKPWGDISSQADSIAQAVPDKAAAQSAPRLPSSGELNLPASGSSAVPPMPAGAPNLQQCPVDRAGVVANLAGALNEIRSMGENTWRRVNLNTFESVAQPVSLRPACMSIQGHKAIINAWGGFAFDSRRADMIIFGGGHGDYCGNDVYRFRLSSMRWERAGLSSQMATFQRTESLQVAIPAEGLSNAPATAHMYDGLMYIPIADRMVYFGYGTPSFSGTGAPPLTAVREPHTGPWFFDPSKAHPDKIVGSNGSGVDPSIPGGMMWKNREYAANHVGAYLPAAYGPQTASSDTVCENGTDVIYMRTSSAHSVSSGLVKYVVNDVLDPARDMLFEVGAHGNHMGQADMAVDVRRLVAVMMGDKTREFAYWDLSTSGARNPMQVVLSVNDLSGGYNLRERTGLDFDPLRDRFLLWDGESGVWELRLPNEKPTPATGWSVRKIQSDGGPVGAFPQTGGGAIGKWKYAPGLDVFLGLREAPNGDVWIYKPHGWVDPAVR